MIDGFDANDTLGQLRIMDANMFDQLGLCVGRSGDETSACVGNGFGDGVEIVVIRGDVSAPDRVRLVMNMFGRMIRAQNEPFDIRSVEMEHTRFTVIDPDHRVIVMLAHECFPFYDLSNAGAAEHAGARRRA
jgi:hypothetical protein